MERKSRFTFLLPNDDRRSTAVLAGIAGALRRLPEAARRTVTFDRGSEFAGYAALDRHLALASYFCDPHCPWQKGGVENANGRVRRHLPREVEPGALTRAPPPARREAQRHAAPLSRLPHAARGLRGAPRRPSRAALTSPPTCRASRRNRPSRCSARAGEGTVCSGPPLASAQVSSSSSSGTGPRRMAAGRSSSSSKR